jgi:hypothetical protein
MRSTIYVYDVSGKPKVIDTIEPFSKSFRGGITLDTARINGDLIPDFIVSAGLSGNSAVEIWSGVTNDKKDFRISSFTTFADTAMRHAPGHAIAVDTDGDNIADTIMAVQGTDGTSGQVRSFTTSGVLTGTMNGFTGPWHIARLRCDVTDAIDAAFALL